METALARRVRELGYVLDRTLMDNPRKGQITALMTASDSRRVVVKWVVNPGTGAACGLLKEIRFYRSAGRSHCAVPIHVEDDLLVLAYVDSVPLRRWLRTYLDAHPDDLVAPDFAAVMDRYGDLLEEWYGQVPFVFSADTRTSLAAMMNRLMNSGPSDARGGVLERVANRLLSWPA
nr:hypothetical protein [bacterium]